MGTSGSEGGQQKPTSRKTGRALPWVCRRSWNRNGARPSAAIAAISFRQTWV